MLCSAIIDDVVEQFVARGDRMLLYFYFSFADAAKQDYQALLLSLIAQLLQQGADCEALEATYNKNQKHVRAIEHVLWMLLAGQNVVHIVVDGLNESPEETVHARGSSMVCNRYTIDAQMLDSCSPATRSPTLTNTWLKWEPP